MNLRPGIVLQARCNSTRLPGKALERIGGRTILQHCLSRLLSTGVSRVVLATTTRREDDALAQIAARAGALVYRGSSEDVLQRFAAAADLFELDPVIRATGDNPFVDPWGAMRLLKALAEAEADYVCENGLPIGAALEAMTAAALHYAASSATAPYDREHVTSFIKSHPNVFRIGTIEAPSALTAPALRLTVDTPGDLEWARELYARVGASQPSVADLIVAAARKREVA